MRLGVIIVNYRTSALVCDCLISLYSQNAALPFHVYIVDNNSEDGSLEHLQTIIRQENWDTWITLLPQTENRGFAAGNNAALRYIHARHLFPDYILLLNPDTVVHPGALEHMVHFLDNRPDAGIVGAQLYDEQHVPQSSGRRFPSIWSELDNGARFGPLSKVLRHKLVALPVPQTPLCCDWVSGAAMLVRYTVFEQVGLLDEGYFLYFEELDFCRRTHNAGWQIWLDPAAVIMHLEGQATGIQSARKRRGKYWYDSRRRYFIKHLGIINWFLADVLWGVGRASLLLRHLLRLGGDLSHDPLYLSRDLLGGDFHSLLSGTAFTIRKSHLR